MDKARYGPHLRGQHGLDRPLVYLNTVHLVEKYLRGGRPTICRLGWMASTRMSQPARATRIIVGMGANSLLFGKGDKWKNNKTAVTKSLHAMSFIRTMEDVVRIELQAVLQELSSRSGQKTPVGDLFLAPCANAIAGLLRGSPLQVDDPDRAEVMKVARNLSDCCLSSMLTQISLKCPKLRVPLSVLFRTKVVDVPSTARMLHRLLRKWIAEARTAATSADAASHGNTDDDPGSRVQETAALPRGPVTLSEDKWTFTESEMSPNINNESILQRILTQPQFANVTEEKDAEIIQSLADFFFGGVTSTSSGVEFVLMYLSKHPDIRLRVQEEVGRVAGSEVIRWSMRDEMPFVRACITEGLRLGCVTPSSLPHVAMKDTEIEGYTVRKGTSVLASIYSLHRDPEFYTDPEEFKPQRHIDEAGRFVRPYSYRAYGVGARRCVGEAMAEIQIFLYVTSVLRQFDLESADTRVDAEMDTRMRIVHGLADFKCVFSERK
ncbi:Cytochrome P450 2E1 [Bulinus truncatus]|nr:Cytochrome P450 2E1 [Bulinus truncatus]